MPIAVDTLAEPKTLPTTVGMEEKNPPFIKPLSTAKTAKGARVVDAGQRASMVSELPRKNAARVFSVVNERPVIQRDGNRRIGRLILFKNSVYILARTQHAISCLLSESTDLSSFTGQQASSSSTQGRDSHASSPYGIDILYLYRLSPPSLPCKVLAQHESCWSQNSNLCTLWL